MEPKQMDTRGIWQVFESVFVAARNLPVSWVVILVVLIVLCVATRHLPTQKRRSRFH